MDAMSKPTQASIYRIVCIVTGEFYIGSTTTQCASRLRCHYSSLRKGNHRSLKLQDAWNRYGAEAFRDEVLERCQIEKRFVREQWYLDNLQPVLNTVLRASGHSQTERTRRAIGLASKEWWVKNKQTIAQQTAMIESLKLGRAKSKANKPGWTPTHRIGVKDSQATKEKRVASRLAFEAARREAGIKGCWITDGESERMIASTDALPDGWRYGRQPKIGEIGRSRVGEKRSDEARANMSKAHKYEPTSCADCGVDTTPPIGRGRDRKVGRWEHYMVRDHIWKAAKMSDGFLCIGCLEVRLGRMLTPQDFTALPINNPHEYDTPRLRDRKGGSDART